MGGMSEKRCLQLGGKQQDGGYSPSVESRIKTYTAVMTKGQIAVEQHYDDT